MEKVDGTVKRKIEVTNNEATIQKENNKAKR